MRPPNFVYALTNQVYTTSTPLTLRCVGERRTSEGFAEQRDSEKLPVPESGKFLNH